MFVLLPELCEKPYKKSAQIFCELYEKITGISLKIKTEPSDNEDMVVIGSEAVQPYVKEVLGASSVRNDTDDYHILSKEENGRRLLFLIGGRGRSTIYAVYDFFERYADCHYFWDGDVIPHKKEIEIKNLDIKESPRFDYRCIRYFAHRGLKRFQAELWNLEDWKKEIDWVMKKRLNVFMLRIGIDDIFQKAFPDIVDYPSNYELLPEAGAGYDNRTTFWSLQYRGELRKKVLEYAFLNDIMHPEDCGTMTHWYSRTPKQFLEKVNPDFLLQTTNEYSEKTGLVWNVLKDENFRNYEKLTEASLKNYGKPELFHTIGLAERSYYEDRKKNIELKKYVYKKIFDYISKNYPSAPVLVAAWDFFHSLKPEETREIIATFDPEKTIILDYTMDLKAKGNDFENWDIIGKMPWIFGIFHAYEPQNYIHGDYDYIEKKLKIADTDPYCKGMTLWPELSHSDTLMLEYYTQNSWRPANKNISEIVFDLCNKRYGEDRDEMKEIWDAFIPLLKLPTYCYTPCCFDMLSSASAFWRIVEDKKCRRDQLLMGEIENKDWEKHLFELDAYEDNIKKLFELIKNISTKTFYKPFISRDLVDILKAVVMQMLEFSFIKLSFNYLNWTKGAEKAETVFESAIYAQKLLNSFNDVLGLNKDHSIYYSYESLKETAEVNPYFEDALKDNVINEYCRTAIYEAGRGVYQFEVETVINWILNNLKTNTAKRTYPKEFEHIKAEIFKKFKKTSLSEFHKEEKRSHSDVMTSLINII